MEQEQDRLEAQNAYLREEIRIEQNFGDLIGESPGLRKVVQQIQLVAPTDATVLITGRKRHRQRAGRAWDPRAQLAKWSRSSQVEL